MNEVASSEAVSDDALGDDASSDALLADIGSALAGRLRSLATALDRLDRLESGSGEWLSGFNKDELPEAATALTLRALHTGADPVNVSILRALAAGDSQGMAQLMEATGLGRLALSERLNDFVQVGLAARLIDTDQAQITAAGASLVVLIDRLIAETTRQYLHGTAKARRRP